MRVILLLPALFLAVLVTVSGFACAADKERGERVFKRCAACHTLEAGGDQEKGPSLHGIFGRKAGTVEGYAHYSEAMKSSDVVWTEETLDAFLKKPKSFIVGNEMSFSGLRKGKDRVNLIAYLLVATQ